MGNDNASDVKLALDRAKASLVEGDEAETAKLRRSYREWAFAWISLARAYKELLP